MRKKDDFKIYFMAFLEELKDGSFNQRVPKKNRIKFMKKGVKQKNF